VAQHAAPKQRLDSFRSLVYFPFQVSLAVSAETINTRKSFMKNHLLKVLAVLVFAIAPLHAQSSFPDHCPNQSPIPFAAIELKHPIDLTCGIDGLPTASANSHLQNVVKNNLCATSPTGQPETFTPQMLIDLQANTHVSSGFGQEPSDRKPLQDLGEGKLIRMKAFLLEAHHADLGSGESVNCKGPTEESNDVHIAFGPQAGTQECDSVTAEITPHYRPASWNEIGHYEVWNNSTKKYTPDPAMTAAHRPPLPRHRPAFFRCLASCLSLWNRPLHAGTRLAVGDSPRLQHRSLQGRNALR
jgi:hypothetical protein